MNSIQAPSTEHSRAGGASLDIESGAFTMQGEQPRAQGVINEYLMENCQEFKVLTDIREKLWKSKSVKVYFEKQRQKADNATKETQQFFYGMMRRIGQEMNESTGAFKINTTPAKILDMCMAPGGFLSKALEVNPRAQAVAFSLSPNQGGHKVLMEKRRSVKLEKLDVTMLAGDLGHCDIPAGHPDAGNFLKRRLQNNQLFNLVLCDGQVLRTHTLPAYREKRETSRLAVAQLAIGLDHLKHGGTIIMLFHKVEVWPNLSLLHRLRKISSVQLFKSTTSHATRSSFYVVASNVQSRHEVALATVRYWREIWRVATFGTDDEFTSALREDEVNVENVLREFGPAFVDLGRGVWNIQANALAKARFMRRKPKMRVGDAAEACSKLPNLIALKIEEDKPICDEGAGLHHSSMILPAKDPKGEETKLRE